MASLGNDPSGTEKPRGFAALSKDERWEMSHKGGRTAHRLGRAHQWTPEQAREAAKKGAAARLRTLARRRGVIA